MTISTFTRSATAALVAVAVLAGPAAAAPGFIDQPINMRAGPGVDYPWVASLPQGTPAEVFGCLPGWSWCDVATGGLRGWVAGPGVEVLYQNQPMPLYGYGQQIGIPFIGFDFGNYWGRYYRGRPWYTPVDRWHGGGGPGFDHGPGFNGGPRDRGPGGGGPGFVRGGPPAQGQRPQAGQAGPEHGPGNGHGPAGPRPDARGPQDRGPGRGDQQPH